MPHQALHHVYLIPGLFGFGKLAGYDYFEHVEHALAERFAAAGVRLHMEVVPALPTASIPMRAAVVAELVARTSAQDTGPIHLLGHSTGGLDARLLMAPGIRLPVPDAQLAWRPRVRSLVALNTPHHGTPLAAYFTTVAGTRILYALSLLTVTSLSLGRVPLSVFSSLVSAFNGIDLKLGLQIKPLDDLTARLMQIVNETSRREVSAYLDSVKRDQGGIIQLMPEVMELFNAMVVDNPAVRYGCVVTAAPAPGARGLLSSFGSPLGPFQMGAYSTVYGFARRTSPRYPYATPDPAQTLTLTHGLREPPRPDMVDGIVPTLSMLWGELLWCGVADHLDVVGHFGDRGPGPRKHVDWLRSGANFRRDDFAAMADALSAFLLR